MDVGDDTVNHVVLEGRDLLQGDDGLESFLDVVDRGQVVVDALLGVDGIQNQLLQLFGGDLRVRPRIEQGDDGVHFLFIHQVDHLDFGGLVLGDQLRPFDGVLEELLRVALTALVVGFLADDGEDDLTVRHLFEDVAAVRVENLLAVFGAELGGLDDRGLGLGDGGLHHLSHDLLHFGDELFGIRLDGVVHVEVVHVGVNVDGIEDEVRGGHHGGVSEVGAFEAVEQLFVGDLDGGEGDRVHRVSLVSVVEFPCFPECLLIYVLLYSRILWL